MIDDECTGAGVFGAINFMDSRGKIDEYEYDDDDDDDGHDYHDDLHDDEDKDDEDEDEDGYGSLFSL